MAANKLPKCAISKLDQSAFHGQTKLSDEAKKTNRTIVRYTIAKLLQMKKILIFRLIDWSKFSNDSYLMMHPKKRIFLTHLFCTFKGTLK